MKILVAVASKRGSTREIGAAIAEELRAHNLSVDLRDVGEVAGVGGYDAVVLGSGIYAGHWLPEASRFAEEERAALSRVPVWIFSSGPLGVDPQPLGDPALLASALGEVPVRDHRIFAGRLDTSALGFGERLMVKLVGAPEGDFRDWEEIREWAREIAAQVPLPA
jgi:menaquinone-dependent protoporphyrinogen oxidase